MQRFTLSLLLLSAIALQGQQKAREHIKAMCGCYEVTFEYAETFAPSPDYEFHDRYKMGGLEWITLDEDRKDHLVIQHLLVVGDTMVIKHWRQDWTYEDDQLLAYQKNLEWKKKSLPSSQTNGTWTQQVFQVDDSPRYEGSGSWHEAAQGAYWRSTADAPLPRREAKKRDDYNVMQRRNEHRLTEDGHVHDLDNAKIIRGPEGDSLLVREKGRNYYRKVNDENCDPARKWWKEHRPFWEVVRNKWAAVQDSLDYITVAKEKDGKKLWQALFALDRKHHQGEPLPQDELESTVSSIIDSYVSDEPQAYKNTSTASKD